MCEPALRALLASHPLASHPLAGGDAIFTVDASAWMRCDAKTSPRRGVYYHPSRHSAGQPVVAGGAHQWVAQLGFAPDSWTAPMDVRRLQPHENVNTATAEQISALLQRLPPDGPLPWFVFDAGYDLVQLAQALADAQAAILVRLRAGRSFDADPLSRPATGRPRRHGHKFDCADAATWPHRQRTCAPRIPATGRSTSGRGPGCIPTHRSTRRAARAGLDRSCPGRLCWSRSAGCPHPPTDPATQAAVAVVAAPWR